MINFGLEYAQVQKKLLHDLEVPYGVLDATGKLMWENEALSALTGNLAVRKNIQAVFPSVDFEKVQEMKEKCYLEIVHEDRIYRTEFCRMHVEDFAEHNNLVGF